MVTSFFKINSIICYVYDTKNVKYAYFVSKYILYYDIKKWTLKVCPIPKNFLKV